VSETLAAQLAERNQANRARIPQAALRTLDDATATLVDSGRADAGLAVGDAMPDFTLPDHTGNDVSLSSLLARGPVVVSFYRGGWCPYCSLELRALQTRLEEITAAGATLVAISPQTPDDSLSTAEKLELRFPVLSDVGNVVADKLGLVFTIPEPLREVYQGFGIDLPAANGDHSFRLPIPATYVLGRDGTVLWRHVDPDYTRRAEPDDVLAALRAAAAGLPR